MKRRWRSKANPRRAASPPLSLLPLPPLPPLPSPLSRVSPEMPEEELDFDDPSFLLPAPTPTSELTYAEKRKRTLALSHDKSRAPPSKRSRKQQEEDAREEGLRRNLIARDTEEGESKALKMMKCAASFGRRRGSGC